MTSKFSIDNRDLLQRISSGEAVVGIDFGNLIVRELAAFRLAAMDSEPVAWIAQNKNTGEVEIDEPFAKATNPKYWTDAFPVYRHVQTAPQLKPVGYLFVSGQGAIAYSPTDWGMPGFKLAGQIFGDIDVELKPAPVVPEEMTPEMMRSVQLNSELGAYAAPNLSGAYDLFAEFWKEACRAAMLNQVQEPATDNTAPKPEPVITDDRLLQNLETRINSLEIGERKGALSTQQETSLKAYRLAVQCLRASATSDENATDNTAQQFEALATRAQPEIIGYEHRLICGELRRVPKFAGQDIEATSAHREPLAVVKHYTGNTYPTLKFAQDEWSVCGDRDDVQELADAINALATSAGSGKP